MGVPSVDEDNQINTPESPKLPTSDLNSETNHRDTSCLQVNPKNDTSENLGTGPALDDVAKNPCRGELESIHENAPADSHPPDDVSNHLQPILENGPLPDDVSKIESTENLGLGELEPMEKNGTQCDTNSNTEELRGPLDDVAENGELVPMEEDATYKKIDDVATACDDVSNHLQPILENGPLPDDVSKIESTENLGLGELEPMEKNGTQCDTNSNTEELRGPLDDVAENGELVPMGEDATCKKIDDVATACDDLSKNQDPTDEVAHGDKPDDVATNSNSEESGSTEGEKGTNVKLEKGKNKLTRCGSPRVLRSRSEEKAKVTEPSTNLDESLANKENKRKKKKKKKMENDKKENEFLRIKTHLRYLLTRMSYEQNLIDAYSGEGWKGQSLEKIKPEKELERAKSEIFRCKLKMRDLFQRIHISCIEGRLPEDLFDSEGEIDSEDIFCAKCGSKELPVNNDIILCDGACERGFHQFCLDPPLLSKDIPPGDEGWLCPGCDCKVDCIELLNDSQGTNLCITDSWEEVFAEAAAAASGTNMADISGLPSDDSEDNDYDPDGPQLDDETQYAESSSSDESDFSSASDDLTALNITNPCAELLPSDDSEDHDYNPNCQDPDKNNEKENSSSSSDFTSDSEYFSAGSDNNGERSESGGTKKKTKKKKSSLSDEILYLLEMEKSGSAPLAEKRHVERLDYKKLHDEEYGNASSDSNDEDYITTPARKRRKTNNGKKVESPSPKRKKSRQKNQKEIEKTPNTKTGKNLEDEIASDSPAKSSKNSSGPDSSGKTTTNRKLGEPATQTLLESFNENRYPSRVAKENLAKDLSLTLNQVSKWFENARWSANHTSRVDAKLAESATRKKIDARKLRPTKSRKSLGKSDNKMENTDDSTSKAQEVRRSGRFRSKSTNSGS